MTVNGVIVTTPQDFFETFVPQSLVAVDEMLSADVVVAFHIEGPGGGSWQLERHDDGSRVGPAADGPKGMAQGTKQLWVSLVEKAAESAKRKTEGLDDD